MALGLGMKVIAFDAFMDEKIAKAMGVVPVSLEKIYEKSDVISIHVPLTQTTKGMIDKDSINKMRKGVYIINASRGGIVNETDLLDACRSGKVAGAALDVLEEEPPGRDYQLVDRVHENIIVTPHVAFNTEEASEAIRELYTEQLVCVSRGRIPPAVVNKKVLTHPRVLSWMTDKK